MKIKQIALFEKLLILCKPEEWGHAPVVENELCMLRP
jgi:hypothetical protein